NADNGSCTHAQSKGGHRVAPTFRRPLHPQTPPMSANEPTPTAQPAALEPGPAESVIIRPWPKVVFLYPTFVISSICFLLSWLDWVSPTTLGNTFMVVLLLYLLVFSFDFSRIKSITLVITIIALVLLILWADHKWELTSFLGRVFGSIDIQMNTGF